MANVTWKSIDGTTLSAEVDSGVSLMEAAVNLNITGVFGDCGGALSCATCHVIVDDGWFDKMPPPSDMETELLSMVSGTTSRCSRLSCQIQMSDELDGIILHVGA